MGRVLLPRYMSIKVTLTRSVMQQTPLCIIYIFSSGEKLKNLFSTQRVETQQKVMVGEASAIVLVVVLFP